MDPVRTIHILTKMKTIHEMNPNLAMSDISNDEIIKALDIGVDAIKTLIDVAKELIKNLEEGGENGQGDT